MAAPPLTADEIDSVFEVLEVPNVAGYSVLHNIGSVAVMAIPGVAAANTRINAAIVALADNSILVVRDLVAKWVDVRLKVGKMEAGSVGDLNGLSYTWDDYRTQVRRLMLSKLPFYKLHEVLAKEEQGGGGLCIPVTR